VLLRAALLAGLAVSLTACGGGGSSATTQASQLPPGCTTNEVQSIVTSFLARPSLAPAGFFTSYGSRESDGRAFTTTSAPKALAHLEGRLRLGERDRLLQLRVSPVDINHVRIAFTITRTAPDFPARGIHFRIATGDGTVDCAHGKVAQWSQRGP
jgi:hypothetical protein